MGLETACAELGQCLGVDVQADVLAAKVVAYMLGDRSQAATDVEVQAFAAVAMTGQQADDMPVDVIVEIGVVVGIHQRLNRCSV
ncbi:hypothetical protein [Lysobacter sp. 22409]|uniref:hypothetical protein n=1 Tax=Lysobacter sp. 22409 TaxID=3453917 RepID=UPI003F84426B